MVVVLLVEPVTPPVESEPVVPEGELVLPEVELDPVLPVLEPLLGPPMELVLPLVLGGVPLLLVVESALLVLPLVLGAVPAVLEPVPEPVPAVEGVVVLLDELVEPAGVEPVVASRLLQAPSERAATTARVATAHWVRDVFIRNS